MTHDTEAFRVRYRAGISRWYKAWLHGGFVLAFGLLVLAFLIGRIEAVRAWEWLSILLGLVVFNWGEYTVHRQFGHHKRRLGALFYKRHTGDHHSFFVETRMPYEQARDWRVIFFPAWLIVLYCALGVLPAYFVIAPFNPNVAALFTATLLAGYLSYEIFHACEHLPPEHVLARLPWLRHMRQLHALHHRRDLMQSRNFNLVFPLMDWLHGTLYWESPSTHPIAEPALPVQDPCQ